MMEFLSVVGSLDREACRMVMERTAARTSHPLWCVACRSPVATRSATPTAWIELLPIGSAVLPTVPDGLGRAAGLVALATAHNICGEEADDEEERPTIATLRTNVSIGISPRSGPPAGGPSLACP
jgi:hypothetical protein